MAGGISCTTVTTEKHRFTAVVRLVSSANIVSHYAYTSSKMDTSTDNGQVGTTRSGAVSSIDAAPWPSLL